MQLVLRLQQNLQVLKSGVERNQNRLPYAIANHYLDTGEVSSVWLTLLEQQIHTAKERLAQFEPIVPQIAIIEKLLSSPNLDSFYIPLEQRWRFTIDKIGDLTVPQMEMQQLVKRLQLLLQSWTSIVDVCQKIKSLPDEKDKNLRSKYFGIFFKAWNDLWTTFFGLEDFATEQYVIKALEQFAQLQAHLEAES